MTEKELWKLLYLIFARASKTKNINWNYYIKNIIKYIPMKCRTDYDNINFSRELKFINIGEKYLTPCMEIPIYIGHIVVINEDRTTNHFTRVRCEIHCYRSRKTDPITNSRINFIVSQKKNNPKRALKPYVNKNNKKRKLLKNK